MPLTRLDLNTGAGQVDVDLTGDRKTDLTADIEGGVAGEHPFAEKRRSDCARFGAESGALMRTG